MATCARPKPQPDVIIAYDKLTFDQRDVIGRGAFATVYKARHVDWGCYVAYKKLHVNLDHDFTSGQPMRLNNFANGSMVRHNFVS